MMEYIFLVERLIINYRAIMGLFSFVKEFFLDLIVHRIGVQ